MAVEKEEPLAGRPADRALELVIGVHIEDDCGVYAMWARSSSL